MKYKTYFESDSLIPGSECVGTTQKIHPVGTSIIYNGGRQAQRPAGSAERSQWADSTSCLIPPVETAAIFYPSSLRFYLNEYPCRKNGEKWETRLNYPKCFIQHIRLGDFTWLDKRRKINEMVNPNVSW